MTWTERGAAVRLAAFAVALALLLAGGLALGGAVGPFDDEPPQPRMTHEEHP